MDLSQLRSKVLNKKLEKFDSKILEEHVTKKGFLRNLLEKMKHKGKRSDSFYEPGDVRIKDKSKMAKEFMENNPSLYPNH